MNGHCGRILSVGGFVMPIQMIAFRADTRRFFATLELRTIVWVEFQVLMNIWRKASTSFYTSGDYAIRDTGWWLTFETSPIEPVAVAYRTAKVL